MTASFREPETCKQNRKIALLVLFVRNRTHPLKIIFFRTEMKVMGPGGRGLGGPRSTKGRHHLRMAVHAVASVALVILDIPKGVLD